MGAETMKSDEWQTVALYVAVGLIVAITLYRWHVSERYKQFTLVDLVAEDGKISSRKFMEFGAWVTATIAIVTMTIANRLTVEYFSIYIFAFVLGRMGGQALHTYQSTSTRKAEIMRGRATDPAPEDLSVEEREVAEGADRRGLTRRF